MADIAGYTIVAKSLKRLGVTHVCSVPGGPVLETIAACAEEGIRPIGMRNEQAAVMMAAAQNYCAGKLVCVPILASGPGVSNAATGMLVAKDNCWPLLVLGGRSALNTRGLGPFQELDGVPVFRPLTKWAETVDRPTRIPDFLARGVLTATSGRPGPVFLDLPQDVLLSQTDEERVTLPHPYEGPARPAGDPELVKEAAELLLNAESPLMIVGKGVRWSEPFSELRELAESLGMPFLTSPMGRGFIPDDHPLCFGAARSMAQRGADVVLLVGTRLNWTFRLGTELGPDTKIIQIDIDPTEIGLNRQPTVGIVGDVKPVLRQLLGELEGRTSGIAERAAESPWVTGLQEKRTENESGLENFYIQADQLPMTPHRMLKEIKDFIPRDTTVVVDGNIILGAGRQVIPSYEPATRLNSGSNGCMGVGVPFALGAKLARPDKPVVGIIGDCAFGFSAMEMETALRHNIPVVYLIANNDGISGATIQDASMPDHPERVMMYLEDIHYERVITAFGGHAEYVERPEDIQPAMQRAFDSGKAACINVKLDPRAPFPGPGGQMRPHRATLSY